MKLIFPIIFFSYVCFALKVVVDPGHGGTDRGAVYGSAQESKLVFEISKNLKELLEKNNYTVDLTRAKDEFVSLQKRVAISQQAQGDLFVSLHANASEDKRAKGIEFFLQPPQINTTFAHKDLTSEDLLLQDAKSENEKISLSKKDDLQKIVSDLSQNIKLKRSLNLTATLKKDLPGVIKQAPFYVLTKTQMPSVLIEVGFLSHAKENKKLLKPEYQKELAEKIFESIQSYAYKLNPSAKNLDENIEIPK